ncbi:hypothetical protein Pelo_7024 [Pelomyxa schiedti]|nr:hypothetical protein Pelo_7024 [Pelomyxa schiedti]
MKLLEPSLLATCNGQLIVRKGDSTATGGGRFTKWLGTECQFISINHRKRTGPGCPVHMHGVDQKPPLLHMHHIVDATTGITIFKLH